MIHSLVSADAAILRTKLDDFDFQNPPTDPAQLARDLTETMIENRGLGLAANQIGLPYRAFALMTNPVIVMFNPRIVDTTNDLIIELEEVKTEKFDGITSRCIQHELDHLNGVVFTSLVHPVHLERAKRQKKKIDRRAKKTITHFDLDPTKFMPAGTQAEQTTNG